MAQALERKAARDAEAQVLWVSAGCESFLMSFFLDFWLGWADLIYG